MGNDFNRFRLESVITFTNFVSLQDYHKISEVDYDADKDATPSNDILLALVCNFLEIPKEPLHFDSLSPNVD